MCKKLLIFLLLFIPFIASASIGVGLLSWQTIELGKVKINQTYDLGSMNFCNMGDEAGEFEIRIIYLKREGKKPIPEEWITYDQTEFYLEPMRCAVAFGELKVEPRFAVIKPIKGDYQMVIAGCTKGAGVCVGRWLKLSI